MLDTDAIFQDQNKIIKMIARREPLKKTLDLIAESAEKQSSNGIICSIMLYDPNENVLKIGAAGSLPESYVSCVDKIKVGPNQGACGTAAFMKKTVITYNIEADPLWEEYRTVALSHGLKACWSTPIFSSRKELLGTFAFYYRQPHAPSEDKFKWLESYSYLASIAIEFTITLKYLEEIKLKKDWYPSIGYSDYINGHGSSLEQGLINALKNNEFVMHYQPKINIHTGKISFEALVRWNHPQYGLIYPSAFISKAEETGFIHELGEWILYTSCEQLRQWLHSGQRDISIAINLSSKQFESDELLFKINQTLERTKVPPSLLQFEITESLIMKDLYKSKKILNELRDKGIKIVMDDFGTQYSSLNYIKHLPIDVIKIDRSFVSDIHSDHNTYKIVEMIIILAHELGLTVIAEGVEKEQQLDMLINLKCDEVQGYLFCPPLPAEELEKNFHRIESIVKTLSFQVQKTSFWRS